MKMIISKYGWGLLVLFVGICAIGWKLFQIQKVKASATDRNVKAFLLMIQRSEGTYGPDAYNMLFGGGLFSSFAKHPNQKVVAGGYTSTAAGAYQFLYSTWQEVAISLGLSDFSPASQDLGAIEKIRQRGALDLVIAGRFEEAVSKCRKEWASLPGAGYGQPEQKMATLLSYYKNAGGSVAA